MDALPNAGEFLVWFVVFLFTLTVHEACHSLAAWLGGDSTAREGGQLTLETANGMLMFGVSTAMVFAVMQRLILAHYADLRS